MRTNYLSIVAATSLLSCSNSSANSSVMAEGNVLKLNGVIDHKMREQVEQTPTNKIKRVVITSSGGDVRDAIAIADHLGVNNFDILVRGYCASACASVILAAARRRVVESGASVIFHGSDASKMELSTRVISSAIPPWSDVERENAMRERALYRRQGISLAFFRLGELMRRPICYTVVTNKDGKQVATFVMGVNSYLPSYATMNRFGFGISGQVESPSERLAKIEKLEKTANTRFSVATDDDKATPDSASIDSAFFNFHLPNCTPEMLKNISQNQ